MPHTPPQVVEQIATARSSRKLREEVITGARFQQVSMIWNQHRINQANARIQSNYIEGLGYRIAEFDQEFWFQQIREYGPDCWSDPDFMEDTLRRNPGIRIRLNLPTRILVDGFRRRSDDKTSAGGNRAVASTQYPLDERSVAAPGRARDTHLVRVIEHSPARSPGDAP